MVVFGAANIIMARVLDHQTWNERYEQLKEYKAKNGDCEVPKKYSAISGLEVWVCRQRVLKKQGTLLDGRIERLQWLGFCW